MPGKPWRECSAEERGEAMSEIMLVCKQQGDWLQHEMTAMLSRAGLPYRVAVSIDIVPIEERVQ
jgi:hypothetical protein